MREESHLDDMRAAIRGDFERLEERIGEQELMRVVDEEPATPEEPEPEPEQELEPAPPVAEVPEPESELVTDDDETEGLPSARSWLDRLLGR